MQTFLSIVGAIALVTVGVLVVGVYWIKRKILTAVEAATIPTPMTITLLKEAEPEWIDESRARRSARNFKDADFADLGVFRVPEMHGALLHCFYRSSDRLIGLVTEVPGADIWEEIGFECGEDDVVYVCNSQNSQLMDSRPGKRTIYLDCCGIEKLLYTIENIDDNAAERRSVDEHSIGRVLEDNYAKEMIWRMRRGGTSMAEIRRLAGTDTDEDTVLEAWRMQRDNTLQLYQMTVIESWAHDNGISVSSLNDLPQLPLVVPEYISRDELIELLAIEWDLTPAQEDTINRYGESKLPYGLLFDKHFAEIFPSGELIRIREVDQPLPAVIYARPEAESVAA